MGFIGSMSKVSKAFFSYQLPAITSKKDILKLCTKITFISRVTNLGNCYHGWIDG